MIAGLKRFKRAQSPRDSVLTGLMAALVAFLAFIALDTQLFSLSLSLLFWFLLGLTAGEVARPTSGSVG